MYKLKTLLRHIWRKLRQMSCKHEFTVNMIRKGAKGDKLIICGFCPKCGLNIWIPDEVE